MVWIKFYNNLTQVQSELSTLSGTVSGLSTALAALQTSVDGIESATDYSTDLADLASGLAAAQTSIDSLTAQLENFDGNAAELNTISSTLAEVAANVEELLGNNAVLNSNLYITNPVQLLLAESLVDTRTDAPNVIVNGYVEIEFNNTNFDAAQRARVQAVADKIATAVDNDLYIINKASPTKAISLPNLTFVDGILYIEGVAANVPKLLTVSDDIDVRYPGAIHFPSLVNVGDDIILHSSVTGEITSLDFSGVNIDGDLFGSARGIVNLT